MPTFPRLSCSFLAVLALAPAAPAADSGGSPRLAVVIAVDQLCGDYMERFGPYFGEGGFKRLLQGGTTFTEAHHRHAIAHTGPGHAVVLTGAFANTHGIISNEWVDRETWAGMNCVEDRDSPLVGITPGEMGPLARANPARTGRSPRNLAAETVGDRLKQTFGRDAKVFAAGNKDRSAILLAGRRADAAYWDENGRMVTSTYYRSTLPAWVEAFNAEDRAGRAFGRTWDRLREVEIYDRVQGPDDAPGEAADFGFTRTFPKRLTGGADQITQTYYTAFDNSPFAAEMLGEFVQRAIVEEKLGHSRGTDLLCIGFSQLDAIGHNYGPHSHEVMDSMLRLDRVLASLLDFLDRQIGLANCIIVLTADHGVAPLPERVEALQPGTPAGRVRSTDLSAAVRSALDAAYGPLPPRESWAMYDAMSFHLRPSALAAKNVGASEAARVVKQALLAISSIQEVYTRDELLAAAPAPDDDSLLAMNRRSYHAGRGRDVQFVLKPYFIARSSTGTTHGTPHRYDSHVALVWFGRGVPAGVRPERVGIEDIAPTLAALLGVPAPAQSEGRPLFPGPVARLGR
jgi:predicted AlkP superfamily pyrophosphatase or phosphodiesterase